MGIEMSSSQFQGFSTQVIGVLNATNATVTNLIIALMDVPCAIARNVQTRRKSIGHNSLYCALNVKQNSIHSNVWIATLIERSARTNTAVKNADGWCPKNPSDLMNHIQTVD